MLYDDGTVKWYITPQKWFVRTKMNSEKNGRSGSKEVARVADAPPPRSVRSARAVKSDALGRYLRLAARGGEKKEALGGRLRDQYTLGAVGTGGARCPGSRARDRGNRGLSRAPVTDVARVPHLQRHRHRVGRLMFSFGIPVCRRPCPTKYSAYARGSCAPYLRTTRTRTRLSFHLRLIPRPLSPPPHPPPPLPLLSSSSSSLSSLFRACIIVIFFFFLIKIIIIFFYFIIFIIVIMLPAATPYARFGVNTIIFY